MLNRFDLSNGFRELVNAAVRLNVIDAVEALCLGSIFADVVGAEEMAEAEAEAEAAEHIMQCAFANRHGRLGSDKHAELCRLNDARCAARG